MYIATRYSNILNNVSISQNGDFQLFIRFYFIFAKKTFALINVASFLIYAPSFLN